MKKLISLILALTMAFTFTACSSSKETTPTGHPDSYSVAIVQQLDHSSLDEIRTAVEAQLEALAQEQCVEITIDVSLSEATYQLLQLLGMSRFSRFGQFNDKLPHLVVENPSSSMAFGIVGTYTSFNEGRSLI